MRDGLNSENATGHLIPIWYLSKGCLEDYEFRLTIFLPGSTYSNHSLVFRKILNIL